MTDAQIPRIIAVADSDSYVKWAAALLAPVPGAELIVLETELVVSAARCSRGRTPCCWPRAGRSCGCSRGWRRGSIRHP